MNPADSSPIMICNKWHEDPMGGPAIQENTYSIPPGHAMDLSIIGLEPGMAEEENNTKLRRALESIISLTHSFVLAEMTIDCKHTYSEIASRAREALTLLSK